MKTRGPDANDRLASGISCIARTTHFSSEQVQESAKKANSRGATGHLIGISVICTTSFPPSQVLNLSRKALAPS